MINKVLTIAIILVKFRTWHSTGHMLVALIAKNEIEQKNLEVMDKLNNIVKVLTSFTKENDYPFVESAEWPDDIKYLMWNSFDEWHFNDDYYYQQKPKKILPKNP